MGYPLEPKTLGERLRRRRFELGLRQRDLAERFGVSATMVGLWEMDRSQPLVGRLPAIDSFLGLALEDLPEDLPSRLRALRRRLGLTQEQFAKRIGQDEAQICRWEGGSRTPHPSIRARLERELLLLEGKPVTTVAESFARAVRWQRRLRASCASLPVSGVGEQLLRERLERGLSRSELARRLRVSRRTLQRIEHGASNPGARVTIAIRSAIGAPLRASRTPQNAGKRECQR